MSRSKRARQTSSPQDGCGVRHSRSGAPSATASGGAFSPSTLAEAIECGAGAIGATVRSLLDATRYNRGWPTGRGLVHVPVTLVVYGRETRTVWYERGAPEVDSWIWYGPVNAYVPTYVARPAAWEG